MPATLQVTLLLCASNVFMTFAWYAYLKNPGDRPRFIARLCILGAVYSIFRS